MSTLTPALEQLASTALDPIAPETLALHDMQPASQEACYHSTRVLVSLGNYNLNVVIPLLEQAILSDDESLRWTALQEIVELGKTYPEKIVEFLEDVASQKKTSTTLSCTRVLVELGKENLADALPLLEKGLNSTNPDLQWTSVLELLDLARVHPLDVVPLFSTLLLSPNIHLKWIATIKLVELAKEYPAEIAPLLETTISQREKSLKEPRSQFTTELFFSNPAVFEQAILHAEPSIQWQATLKLLELAPIHPKEVIPFFELALTTHNPNLHWAIMLQIVRLAKQFPDIITPVITKILAQEQFEPALKETRVLIELGLNNFSEVMPVFEQALTKTDPNLQSAAVLELIELLNLHIKKLVPMIKKMIKGRAFSPNDSLNSPTTEHIEHILGLLDKLLLQKDSNLQWTTFCQLLHSKIFTPQQLLTTLDKIVHNQLTTYPTKFATTRVLVELGVRNPQLVAPIMDQALQSTDPELHWSAILEATAIMKLCPEITAYLANNPEVLK